MTHWLITGASGLLGHALVGELAARGEAITACVREHPCLIPDVQQLNIDFDGDLRELARLFRATQPDMVVHAAGLTNVDLCEGAEMLADNIHVTVGKMLAQLCAESNCGYVYISTDHLWDGSQKMVSEAVPPTPINAYARSKVRGEQAVLAANPETYVIRTNFFGKGPPWRTALWDWVIGKLEQGQTIPAFGDVYFTPIATTLFVNALVALVRAAPPGIYHLAGGERISKYDFALAIATRLGFSPEMVSCRSVADVVMQAVRPRDMSLSVQKAYQVLGMPAPSFHESLEAVIRSPHLAGDSENQVWLNCRANA